MRMNAYQSYVENEILTADPLKLVVLSYRAALDAVTGARRFLADGDIRGRSRAVTKAVEIIAELNRTLDFEAGGHIAHQLTRLYEFLIHELLEGNRTQTDQPLANAERVLSTLLDGWQSCSESTSLETKHEEVSYAF
jgi:flagellar protein FliS